MNYRRYLWIRVAQGIRWVFSYDLSVVGRINELSISNKSHLTVMKHNNWEYKQLKQTVAFCVDCGERL